jgi:hypothetical protein
MKKQATLRNTTSLIRKYWDLWEAANIPFALKQCHMEVLKFLYCQLNETKFLFSVMKMSE